MWGALVSTLMLLWTVSSFNFEDFLASYQIEVSREQKENKICENIKQNICSLKS